MKKYAIFTKIRVFLAFSGKKPLFIWIQQKRSTMNNFKKIGLTALAGSLVTLGSAQAGEMSVSGSINTTLKFGVGGGNTSRTIGNDRDVTF